MDHKCDVTHWKPLLFLGQIFATWRHKKKSLMQPKKLHQNHQILWIFILFLKLPYLDNRFHNVCQNIAGLSKISTFLFDMYPNYANSFLWMICQCGYITKLGKKKEKRKSHDWKTYLLFEFICITRGQWNHMLIFFAICMKQNVLIDMLLFEQNMGNCVDVKSHVRT